VRYSVFEITGWPIHPEYTGGAVLDPPGSREYHNGPLTTYWVWDEAQCQTVCEHGSRPEANRCARLSNRWDIEDDPDVLNLLATWLRVEHA
jgi:hypothetical protein